LSNVQNQLLIDRRQTKDYEIHICCFFTYCGYVFVWSDISYCGLLCQYV